MKQQLKFWLYVAAVLLMSVSCKKEEPCQCLDCGHPNQKMTLETTLQNARADVGSGGLVIENYGFTFPCYQKNTSYIIGPLKETYVDFQPQPFKYRVWGRIYNCDSCPTLLVAGKVPYVLIDKIEMVN